MCHMHDADYANRATITYVCIPSVYMAWGLYPLRWAKTVLMCFWHRRWQAAAPNLSAQKKQSATFLSTIPDLSRTAATCLPSTGMSYLSAICAATNKLWVSTWKVPRPVRTHPAKPYIYIMVLASFLYTKWVRIVMLSHRTHGNYKVSADCTRYQLRVRSNEEQQVCMRILLTRASHTYVRVLYYAH